jgi:hypothetical protein
MKKRLQTFITALTALLLVLTPLAHPATTYGIETESSKFACEGAQDGSAGTSCTDESSADTVSKIIRVAIGIFQAIIGVISLFVIILSGLNYVTAGGDAGKVKTARERIIYAVIGLIIVGVAQIIVQFALNRAK